MVVGYSRRIVERAERATTRWLDCSARLRAGCESADADENRRPSSAMSRIRAVVVTDGIRDVEVSRDTAVVGEPTGAPGMLCEVCPNIVARSHVENGAVNGDTVRQSRHAATSFDSINISKR